jgi:hypothetical protein
MDAAAFKQQLRWLDEAPPGDAWLAVLRNIYRQVSPDQREQLRQLIGWADEHCREPDDWFTADFADKHRAHLRSEQTFRAYLLKLANGSLRKDHRDALSSIAGAYYLLILRGFDPDAELNAVADSCSPDSAATLHSFLHRPDKALEVWRYEALRRPNGNVTLQIIGI